MPNKTIGSNGLTLLKEVEGLRLKAYLDTGGVWTIGYGHTGPDVKPGLVITLDKAEALLKQDVQTAEAAVNKLVKVSLSQNQFDALCSFTYNVGESQFSTSTLLRLLNAGRYDEAKDQFKRWNKDNGKVVQGLINRRAKEEELFGKQ